MTDIRLKNQIGILVILANLIVIALTLALYLAGGFLFEEMTTIIALIVPMFSVYTTAILKNIVATRTDVHTVGSPVTKQYVFVSWLIPLVFCIYLVTLISLKSLNIGFNSFDQFKTMLVGSETIFGAYVGVILSSMFDIRRKKKKRLS